MPNDKEIIVLSIGYKLSPFIEFLIDAGNIACSYITNNSCDFKIHHADPSKALNYHLEFSNIIEAKAKKNIESLAIFETLGQFFEFYNPLHLSTLNYLVSKYATNISSNKNILETWKEISMSIFDEEFIYPIFEESRIFHVKVGDEEVPARQYIISTELKEKKKEEKLNGEQKKDNEKAGQKSKKKKEKEPEENLEKTTDDAQREEISGLIDLEAVEKLVLCEASVNKIHNAASVVIVPTDMLSLHILFQSTKLKELLKEVPAKIAFIMPIWPGNAISPSETNILVNSNFDTEISSIVDLVKDFVDTIILDNSDSEIVSQIRDAGITAIVEDLTPEGQKKEEFLELVLKSTELSLESVKLESKKEHEKIGKKIVDILSSRFSPKEEEDKIEDAEKTPEGTPVESVDDKEIEEAATEPEVEQKTKEKKAEALPDAPAPKVETAVQEETIKEVKTAPAATAPAADEVKPEETQVEPEGQEPAATPSKEEGAVVAEEGQEVEPEKLLDEKINKVLMPTYEENLESVFSDLLTIQDTPESIQKVFDDLVKKFETMDDLGPEKRIVDILTYLASNKPDEYTDICLEKLRISVQSIDKKIRTPELHTISLLMRYSKPIGEKVLTSFVSEFILEENPIITERTRSIIAYLITKDDGFIQIVMKQLLSLYREELEKEEPSENLITKITFFLYSVDAFSLGQAMIQEFPKSLFDKVKDTLSKDKSNDIYARILVDILDAFQEGNYEKLKASLGVQKIPEKIKSALIKRKYIDILSKVGSIPLEVFAEKSGLSVEEAEKIVYEMIMKGDITAKIELVNGRPYVVQEVVEKKEEDKKEEDKKEEDKKEEIGDAEEDKKEKAEDTEDPSDTEDDVPEDEAETEDEGKGEDKKENVKETKKNTLESAENDSGSQPISKQVKRLQDDSEEESSSGNQTPQRKCPSCGESSFIKETEDKETILSYTPSIVYAKKFVCSNCKQEWKKGEETTIKKEAQESKKSEKKKD